MALHFIYDEHDSRVTWNHVDKANPTITEGEALIIVLAQAAGALQMIAAGLQAPATPPSTQPASVTADPK